MMFRRFLLIVLVAVLALPVRAEVVRIEVKSRADILAGKSFGSAGAFEKLSGKIYFAVDPSLPANRLIQRQYRFLEQRLLPPNPSNVCYRL